MTLVFKRRLLNAILTVYLPTILILTICYATNFFKGFFFELSLLELRWVECLWFRAIVTVNLTSLLVLTTLFISVSSSLPQTAYVKMVGSICISRFVFSFPFIFVFLDLYSYLYHHDTRRLTSGWSLHNLFLGWRWRICIFCKKFACFYRCFFKLTLSTCEGKLKTWKKCMWTIMVTSTHQIDKSQLSVTIYGIFSLSKFHKTQVAWSLFMVVQLYYIIAGQPVVHQIDRR